MMRVWLLVVGSIALSASIGGYIGASHNSDARAKLDDFCRRTRNAVGGDITAFESDDLAWREETLMRFYRGGAMYHNDKSFAMCIDNVPELPPECWFNKDWKCLTETARKVHKALE